MASERGHSKYRNQLESKVYLEENVAFLHFNALFSTVIIAKRFAGEEQL